MLIQKEILNKIKDFGLNSYEAKLWTALLSRGVATAGELSDIADVPRSRSYDVLESLERKGFVIMKLGKPIKYIAVPPQEVIDRVKKRIKEDAEKQEKIVDSLKGSEILENLSSLHQEGIKHVEPSELTGAVKGRENLYTHLSSLIKNSNKSVKIITTEQGIQRKATILKNAFSKAQEKGVKVKLLAPITKNNQEYAKLLSKYAQVKNTNKKNLRFCIVDGQNLSFMTLDETIHPSYDFGVWINSENFAKNFDEVFDELWEKSKDF